MDGAVDAIFSFVSACQAANILDEGVQQLIFRARLRCPLVAFARVRGAAASLFRTTGRRLR
jgi:hypothetical protein